MGAWWLAARSLPEVSGGRKKSNLPAFFTFLKTLEPTACSSRTGVLPCILLLWVGRWVVGEWLVHWAVGGW